MEAKREDPTPKILGDIYMIRRRVEKSYSSGRERSLVLTKLDEAAMWLKTIPVEVGES